MTEYQRHAKNMEKLEADIRAAMEAQDSARQQLISVVTGQVTTAEDEEMGDDARHQMLEEWQQENATDHPRAVIRLLETRRPEHPPWI